MVLIGTTKPKARREYRCDFCGGKILKGETYDNTVMVGDDGLYHWKSHLICSKIASLLWNFIDPDDGMTSDNFHEGVRSYCSQFVCPHCTESSLDENGDCLKDENDYCADKVLDRLGKFELKKVKYEWVEIAREA